MEVSSVHVSLLMNMLLLFDSHFAQRPGGPVTLESPALPMMEGEVVTLTCRNGTTSSNLTADFYRNGVFIGTSSTGNMIISVSKANAGLYKCNISGVGESPEIWLSVRAAVVVLESPEHPVTEGDSVTLRCRKNKTPSDHIADFYKFSFHIGTGYRGEMTIHSVSKSNEGPYKCRISGVGDSPERWLSVRGSVVPVILESPELPVIEGEDVTLTCKNKAAVNVSADFYKDGVFLRSSSTGITGIHGVSKSDEGLYKCNISGVGESPGRWMTVRECPKGKVSVCPDQLLLYLLMKSAVTAVAVTPLLLVLRRFYPHKYRDE